MLFLVSRWFHKVVFGRVKMGVARVILAPALGCNYFPNKQTFLLPERKLTCHCAAKQLIFSLQ